MSFFLSPRQVSRTFKNISRIRTISSVFAKHGFQEWMAQLGFGRFIPKRYRKTAPSETSAAERFRLSLEELGPTFIKLGQLLSSRVDLLPPAYIEELVKLQDRVSPLPFAIIREEVERELGGKLEEVFSSFSDTPLASASIGQVHEASLRDGRSVVVKVQRPGIDSLIKTDISVMTALAAALEKYFPNTQVLSPQTCVEEFFYSMSMELDFVLEANNMLKFKENLKKIPDVYVPDAFLQLSTHKVLVVERLQGVKLNDSAAIRNLGVHPVALADIVARAFLKSALEDGFFHGDLHLGNLFALSPKQNSLAPKAQVGFIDFGIMGYLSPKSRESLVRIFLALSEEDFETLCMEYAELGSSRGKTDFESFQRQIQSTVAPYMGLPLSSMNVGKLLIDATTVAAKHHIRVPREWLLIFRAIYTLEGTCRTLNPAFNPLPLLEEYVAPLIQPKTNWSQFSRDMLLGSRDVQIVAQMLPRQLHWFFKRMAANGYALEVKNSSSEAELLQSEKNFLRISAAIMATGQLLGAISLLLLYLNFSKTWLLVLAIVLFALAYKDGRKVFRSS